MGYKVRNCDLFSINNPQPVGGCSVTGTSVETGGTIVAKPLGQILPDPWCGAAHQALRPGRFGPLSAPAWRLPNN